MPNRSTPYCAATASQQPHACGPVVAVFPLDLPPFIPTAPSTCVHVRRSGGRERHLGRSKLSPSRGTMALRPTATAYRPRPETKSNKRRKPAETTGSPRKIVEDDLIGVSQV